VLIPHFRQYPLLSKKSGDFILWADVVEKMAKKEPLSLDGLISILAHYASINLGVSPKVSKFFPDIVPTVKPFGKLPTSLDPGFMGLQLEREVLI